MAHSSPHTHTTLAVAHSSPPGHAYGTAAYRTKQHGTRGTHGVLCLPFVLDGTLNTRCVANSTHGTMLRWHVVVVL